jgi:hypothetical protein
MAHNSGYTKAMWARKTINVFMVSSGLSFLGGFAFAADVTQVPYTKYVVDNSNVRWIDVSCPTGYTPVGINIVSDRVTAHFEGQPTGEKAQVALANWANNRSGMQQSFLWYVSNN